MTDRPGTAARPLRVAIVGSGPSGFYAAESLFRAADLHVRVDVFDRLPTPYGLVRYGVAPDHQKMKAVIRAYEKTAAREGFRFFGNVELGRDLTVDELRRCYDQVVFAVGAETDRKLGVPGEDLAGSLSSTALVGWYNAHPDHRDLDVDLSCRSVAVVGVGNVAMDVVRVLLRPLEELEVTDIADYALDALRKSAVREIHLLGRRGAAQAAFTPKEIEEIGELTGVDLVVDPAHVRPADAPDGDDANARKNFEFLAARAAAGPGTHERKVHLRFLTSPVEVLGDGTRVTGLVIEKNKLEKGDDGRTRAVGTGQTETLDVGMVVRAIGYRGVPLPGVPFHDGWGIIPNDDGRVTASDGEPMPGLYVVGWAKRGPTGLIGTNKGDSQATVDRMLEDLPSLEPAADGGDVAPLLERRGVRFVTFDDWKLLDAAEVERGTARGRVREKIVEPEAMLEVIREARAGQRS